jgi:hypothetical protein
MSGLGLHSERGSRTSAWVIRYPIVEVRRPFFEFNTDMKLEIKQTGQSL